jgi:uncharacterized protein involved in exopolysaccharide biosynthesis
LHRRITEADTSKYDELCARIDDNRGAIALLSAENAALKAEIARCEAKIAAYPQTKRKYHRLAESLSPVADPRSRSGRRRTRRKPSD